MHAGRFSKLQLCVGLVAVGVWVCLCLYGACVCVCVWTPFGLTRGRSFGAQEQKQAALNQKSGCSGPGPRQQTENVPQKTYKSRFKEAAQTGLPQTHTHTHIEGSTLSGLFFILSSLFNDLSGVGGDEILEQKEGQKREGERRGKKKGGSGRCKRQKSKWWPKKNWVRGKGGQGDTKEVDDGVLMRL